MSTRAGIGAGTAARTEKRVEMIESPRIYEVMERRHQRVTSSHSRIIRRTRFPDEDRKTRRHEDTKKEGKKPLKSYNVITATSKTGETWAVGEKM